ncbi:hypothetical protein ACSS6W_004843 [Trichoderma asperelloides]
MPSLASYFPFPSEPCSPRLLERTKTWVSIYGAAADAPYQAILSVLLSFFTSFA